jgi:hypothetical protein
MYFCCDQFTDIGQDEMIPLTDSGHKAKSHTAHSSYVAGDFVLVVHVLSAVSEVSNGHNPIYSSMVLMVYTTFNLHEAIGFENSKLMLANMLWYNHLVVVVLITCLL